MHRRIETSQFLIIIAALLAVTANATAREQRRGDGSVRLEYQYLRTGSFDAGGELGKINIGHVDGHTLLLAMSYALNERVTLAASLPYIKRRHSGPLPHNPQTEITAWTPPDLSIIDNGDYHSDFQDFYLGIRYLAKSGPVSVEPFVAFSVPTNDYPFYAHAAVGRNIWHIPVGVALGYQPPFGDWYVNGDIAYVFTEKSLGVDISHWLVSVTGGYFLTPRFAPKAWLIMKQGFNGLDFPDDFDVMNLNNEAWYFHDRTIKHNFINGGIGFDYILSEKHQVSGTVGKMLRRDQVNDVELTWTLGLTRFFSAARR